MMDAGNQTVAVRFLRQTAANLGSIETNAPDFTPELLFGNNRPQVKVPFYCCDVISRKDQPSVQFVVRLHQSGGRAASGILLCHHRWEICRPQVCR